MKKTLAILLCTLVSVGCRGDVVNIDLVATANAPWKKDEIIVNGFCSKSAIGGCVRVFLGITMDSKVLVQDFYTKIADRIDAGKVYDPRTTEIEAKFTDPFMMMSIENAQMNLFYVDDGKDGMYRSYHHDGERYKEGTFRNGVKHGHWIVHFSKGTGYEETFENGKLINSREFGY